MNPNDNQTPLLNVSIQVPDGVVEPAEQFPYPLDIVVHHINEAVRHQDSDDDDNEVVNEVNYELKKEGFTVKSKEDGADLEFLSTPTKEDVAQVPVDKTATKSSGSKFRKGHRRAWSMPNANRDKAVLIVADDAIKADEAGKTHHTVRYRLHPYYPNDERSADAVKNFIQSSNFDMQLPLDDEDIDLNEEQLCFPTNIGQGTRSVMKRIWEATWRAQHFDLLPDWLQDNEFLHRGHRPPLPSFAVCFQSIFKLHTETGNIWTHLYGCLAFIGLALFFYTRSNFLVGWQEKVVFSFFFFGAVFCLGFSFSFHTVQCHSVNVGKLFSKLDYSGITMLIVGSFVPWIYYGFYCRAVAMTIYISMITILGIMALIVSLWDKFAEPTFRPLRAIVFVCMGLSSIVPAAHMLITDGLRYMFQYASLHWLLLMGFFYLTGAALYATRFPERFFPGKCDYIFQSHQLFHIFVVVAAFVHFHGICEIAIQRLEQGSCHEQMTERYGYDYLTEFDKVLRPY